MKQKVNVSYPSHKCNVLLGNHSTFRSNIATVKKFDCLRNPYSFWRVHDTAIV